MAVVTVSQVINLARSLVGVDTDRTHCDVMKWYGTFADGVNAEACCCAGMMYLFSKLNALNMIPGGKTANCGTLAVNFYNAGQLYKPSQVRVGDLVLFSWSGNTTSMYPLNTLGYKSFDHVELVIEVGSSTIRTIGCNNGGAECDDFQYKTRSRSNISGCCRPKYRTNSTSVKEVQTWLNSAYKSGLIVDGIYGDLTKAALVMGLQTELNKAYNAKLVVDGVFGTKTRAAVRNISSGARGNYVKVLQGFLMCLGYDTGGLDGIFGVKTTSSVKSYQKTLGLVVDGIAGKATFTALSR